MTNVYEKRAIFRGKSCFNPEMIIQRQEYRLHSFLSSFFFSPIQIWWRSNYLTVAKLREQTQRKQRNDRRGLIRIIRGWLAQLKTSGSPLSSLLAILNSRTNLQLFVVRKQKTTTLKKRFIFLCIRCVSFYIRTFSQNIVTEKIS